MPSVVIIDPLGKFHSSDENSSKEMRRVLDEFDTIINRFNCSVIIVHHHGKPNPNSPGQKTHGGRGSSVLHDWVDSSIDLHYSDYEDRTVEMKFSLRNSDNPNDILIQLMPDLFFHRKLHGPLKGSGTNP